MGLLLRSAAYVLALLVALLICCVHAQPESLATVCTGAASPLNCLATKSSTAYSPYELQMDFSNTPIMDLSVAARALGSASLSLQLSLNGQVISTSKGDLSDSALFVPKESLVAGTYTLRVLTKSLVSTFSLRIQTLSTRALLAKEDRAFLKEFYTACCSSDPNLNPFGRGPFKSVVCDNINGWVTSTTDQTDFCNTAPNSCNALGHIEKAFLRADVKGALAFSCMAPPPAIFAKLPALQILDISNQNLQWSLDQLSAALNGSTVQRVYAHKAQLWGTMEQSGCDMLQNAPSMTVLWAGDNKLKGELPACFLQHPFVQLRLNGNGISGSLPDEFPPNSPLEVLDLEEQDQERDALGGPIPASLGALKYLQVLNLGSNEFTGQIPDLPLTLQELVLSRNRFSGTLPKSLGMMSKLIVLHLGLSRPDSTGALIGGPLPAGFEKLPNLVFAYLSNNSLTGSLDLEWDMPNVQRLSLSMNSFSGPFPSKIVSGCPQLRFLRLGTNQLSGSLDAFAAAIPKTNSLVGLNLTFNQLTGGLPKELNNLAVLGNTTYPVTGEFDYYTGAPIVYKNVLVLTHNKFSAPYPLWVPQALTYLPNSTVALLDSVGDTNVWTCPAKGTGVPVDTYYNLANVQQSFLCTDANGKVADLSTLVMAKSDMVVEAPGSSNSQTNTETTPKPVAAAAKATSSGGSKGLGAGALAGILIALIVVLVALAGLGFFMFKKKRSKASFSQFHGPDSGLKSVNMMNV